MRSGQPEAGDVGYRRGRRRGWSRPVKRLAPGPLTSPDDVVVLGTVVRHRRGLLQVFVFVGEFGRDAVFDFVLSESCDLDAMGGGLLDDGAVRGDLDAGIVDFGGDVGGGTDEGGSPAGRRRSTKSAAARERS